MGSTTGHPERSSRYFTVPPVRGASFPGAYFKGKLEYLRKTWNFTSLGTSFGRPSLSIPTEERLNLEVIQGEPSNILALTALLETPYYEARNLTFIQEVRLRKELTYIQQADEFTELDFQLDATFLTAALALKYSILNGRHYPFIRLGMGGSLLRNESNRFSRTLRNGGGTTTTNGEILSPITLHPALRIGTEFYLQGPYLMTAGLTYSREMMLFRPISSVSNAVGIYLAVNFY